MQTMNNQRISLVMVSSNDRAALVQAIADAGNQLAAVASEYEILVVDCDSDAVPNILDQAASADSHVRIIERPHLSFGAALRDGLQAARFDVLACASAAALTANELTYLTSLLNDCDVAISCRADSSTMVRRLFGAAGRALVALLLGRASAHHNHLTVFRRSMLDVLMPQCDTAFAATEMLSRADLAQLRVAQTALPHAAAARPETVRWRDAMSWLRDLLRYWWSIVLFPAPTSPGKLNSGWFWTGLLVLMCVLAPLQLCGLAYPLTEPDEGRYAELSRHMWHTGDWIIPVVNQQPFYDKPPLFYWLVACSYQIFGPAEWAARLVPALASFFTVLAVYFLAPVSSVCEQRFSQPPHWGWLSVLCRSAG